MFGLEVFRSLHCRRHAEVVRHLTCCPSRATAVLRRFASIVVVFAVVSGLALLRPDPSRADGPVGADGPVRIAVSANFLPALKRIAAEFTKQTKLQTRISAASTGQLFVQISNGAPFDVFLSADTERPARLVSRGLAEKNSQITYATGRLALVVKDPQRLGASANWLDAVNELLTKASSRVAIANPKVAPYGAAAKAALKQAAVLEPLSGRLVLGQNVMQALQFVVTGNADAGLVSLALARAMEKRSKAKLGIFPLPAGSHLPIRQDAVLLSSAVGNRAAVSFLRFLNGSRANAIKADLGYEPKNHSH